ncbi:MAG: CotH kinase family protein [Alistipes sp.]|nr:CotH kinase family protein [Alistipes sp.]
MKPRLLTALLIAIFFTACAKNDPAADIQPENPILEVSTSELRFNCDGGNAFATYLSNRIVTAHSSHDWCAVSVLDSQNDNLRITAAANPDNQERSAIITISAQDCDNIEISVIQEPRPQPDKPYISVSDNQANFPEDGGSITLTASSNSPMSVRSSQNWATAGLIVGAQTDNLKITVSPNPDESERNAIITIAARNCDDVQISIRQDPKSVYRSPDCDLLSFYIPANQNNLPQNINFDFNTEQHSLKAVYLQWIEKDNPQMLIPVFTHNGAQLLADGSPVTSGQTPVSFAQPVQLTVVAENGNTQTYIADLNCPQINTEIPVLRLQPQSAINSKEVYVQTTITLYDANTPEGHWYPQDGDAEVRGRGNSTWGLPKKPYRIKFPSKFSPVGLNHAKAKSWNILAHDMDKSLIRNHIAFQLSKVMFNPQENYHHPSAIMFTPCSKFVNVYMNNQYHGLYQMTDQMEQDEGRIAVEKLTDKDGSDPEKITGGHIIETDIHSAYPPERFNSSHRIQMNHKYPKDDEYDPAQYAYMENFVKSAETALYGSNFKDPDNGWRKYMDEKTLADFIIVKEFVGDMDGYTSTYFYKRRGVDKLFFGPIWDCDKGWNNDKRNTDRNPLGSLMIYAGFYMPPYINPDWFHRLWQDETFRQFVGQRWAQKRAELIETVFKTLDEQPAKMPKAIEANFKVWPFYYQASGEANMPAATYELEIERMRTLTNQRAALLDNLFK